MIWIERDEDSPRDSILHINHIDSDDGTITGMDAIPLHEWRDALAKTRNQYGHMEPASLLDVITGYAIAMETH